MTHGAHEGVEGVRAVEGGASQLLEGGGALIGVTGLEVAAPSELVLLLTVVRPPELDGDGLDALGWEEGASAAALNRSLEWVAPVGLSV